MLPTIPKGEIVGKIEGNEDVLSLLATRFEGLCVLARWKALKKPYKFSIDHRTNL